MSEIVKCPCCEGSLNIYEGGVECKNCPFQCAIENFEQICAAMELAKLTVQMKTCRAYCPERVFLRAQEHVLEVFNGNNL